MPSNRASVVVTFTDEGDSIFECYSGSTLAEIRVMPAREKCSDPNHNAASCCPACGTTNE